LQIDINVRRTGRFGESKRIVEQGFGRADLNEQRREPFQIGIDRRGQRRAGIGAIR
jgi:hypothetical protein